MQQCPRPTCHPRIQSDTGGRQVKKTSEEVLVIQCDTGAVKGKPKALGAEESLPLRAGMGFPEGIGEHCDRGPCSGIRKIWACGPGKQLDLYVILLVFSSTVVKWLPEHEAFFFLCSCLRKSIKGVGFINKHLELSCTW